MIVPVMSPCRRDKARRQGFLAALERAGGSRTADGGGMFRGAGTIRPRPGYGRHRMRCRIGGDDEPAEPGPETGPRSGRSRRRSGPARRPRRAAWPGPARRSGWPGWSTRPGPRSGQPLTAHAGDGGGSSAAVLVFQIAMCVLSIFSKKCPVRSPPHPPQHPCRRGAAEAPGTFLIRGGSSDPKPTRPAMSLSRQTGSLRSFAAMGWRLRARGGRFVRDMALAPPAPPAWRPPRWLFSCPAGNKTGVRRVWRIPGPAARARPRAGLEGARK